ncbi:hypothetical protein VTL71DRAFT_7099 [Oculimacula yallundae]|uniref:Uncharacterized protein n=1 Tax=Oculimacula yallundae TaxID=86028 RepID=A0ABR4BVU5_9HELO
MKYSAVVLALATGALAGGYEYPPHKNATVAYETITTSALTTYCPYATTIVQNSKTYTVTEATTLTITDCPCTIVKPAPYPTGAPPAPYPAGPASKPVGPGASYPAGGASTVLYTSCPPDATKPAATYPAGPPASKGPAYTNPLTAVYPTGPAAGGKKTDGVAVGTGGYPAKPAATGPVVYTGAASANKVGSFMIGAAALVVLAL